MSRARRLISLCALMVLATSCERMTVGSKIASELHAGREYAASIESRARDAQHPPGSGTIIALGYLERHRLGLGGPFRLTEYALHDSRIGVAARDSLAWALIARTLDGDGDQVDPRALDSLSVDSSEGGDGAAHLALIERTIRDAPDPRAGELAVRLAYALAAAEHVLRRDAPRIAAQAAALIRDRELARADARMVLREAWHRDDDPLRLLRAWRRERRFAVEQPLIEQLPAASELAAMELAPRLAERVRALTVSPSGQATPAGKAPGPLITVAAAERLAALARVAGTPPETPVVVSMMSYRDALTEPVLEHANVRWARFRFLRRSRGEEALAAEHAIVEAHAPGMAVERATLAAAVALRAYAQETPWYIGAPVPTAADLSERFGLAAVTFDPSVPDQWRPYYRAMLASALGDLERVLPELDLSGLRVTFGDPPVRAAALALHDPLRRIIYLPLATSAGTIAHEIAHDIDWQAALTRYAIRGDYATDRAVRDSRQGGRLAESLRGLTAASVGTVAEEPSGAPVSMRPTEVFARGVDWFVAVSLAREGRMDGYLSSVQDDLLTGYVTVAPPDVSGEAGSAIVSILDDVAPPAPAEREWFLTRYGQGRVLTPFDLVRRVLEPPIASPDTTGPLTLMALVAPVRRIRDSALALVDAGRCGAARDDEDQRLNGARRALVDSAAAARARGIMRRRGTVLAVDEAGRWAAGDDNVAPDPFRAAGPIAPAFETANVERARATGPLDTGIADDAGLASCGFDALLTSR